MNARPGQRPSTAGRIEINEARVIDYLEKNGASRRVVMAAGLGLPPSSLFVVLTDMAARDLVDEVTVQRHRRGRPWIFYALKK